MEWNLVRAELLKLRSTRMLRWMAASTLAIVVLNVALTVLNAGRGQMPPLTSPDGVEPVFAAAGTGMTLMLIVGIMMVAGEFRHGTATSTFLVTPRRQAVLLSKTLAAAIAGGVFAVIAVATTLAVAVPWLAAENAAVGSVGDIAFVLGAGAWITVAAGVLGVGFGSVIRNQTAAVAIALSWVLLLESLIAGIVPEVGRSLLSGATAALTTSVGTVFEPGDLLPRAIAGVLLEAYVAVAVVAGLWGLRRADI